MPAKSRSQARLFAAAAHGAKFELAQSIRSQLTKQQLHDFAATPRKGLPERVRAKPKTK